jgi:hypothetical protein
MTSVYATVYAIICLDEDDRTCNVDKKTVVVKVYFSKEKARQNIHQVIKDFMIEYEREVLGYGKDAFQRLLLGYDEDEEEDDREEIEQLSEDEFCVYGKVWTIEETTIE